MMLLFVGLVFVFSYKEVQVNFEEANKNLYKNNLKDKIK
jgi:hypothetical protein